MRPLSFSFTFTFSFLLCCFKRSGRAGRVRAGHCYRLYSSAVYQHDFPQFSSPEILRLPIEGWFSSWLLCQLIASSKRTIGIVLQMKNMNIDNVVNFPFPTPPDRNSIVAAEKVSSFS